MLDKIIKKRALLADDVDRIEKRIAELKVELEEKQGKLAWFDELLDDESEVKDEDGSEEDSGEDADELPVVSRIAYAE